MKYFYYLLTMSMVFSFNSLFAQNEGENAGVNPDPNYLPRWMTQEEWGMMDAYLQSFDAKGITTPPPYTSVRTAAEWEEVQALVITWTGQYNSIHAQIVDGAQEECEVIIMCTDSNDVKSTLNGYGVPDVNISYIETDYNSVWIRDYGANTVYADDVDELILVDWIYNRPRPDDDAIPEAYATYMGIDLYTTTSNPNDITATGGNFMADGSGIAFSSELILQENDGNGPYAITYPDHTEGEIDDIFMDFMGINTYIKMTVLPYDDIHHIDMHMKLIDEETLLVGEYPEGISDGPQIEANLQYVLDGYTTKWGTPFNVVRIPQPSSTSGGYPGGSFGNAYYRTYANQTFVNNVVLLPVYRTEFDTTAMRILEDNMPGYIFIPIDIDNSGQNLISAGGGIHCITHTVGVDDPLYISHLSLVDTEDDLNPYPVEAEIKHKDGIASASIFYKTDIAGAYTEVPMSQGTGDMWNGLIPAQPIGTTVYYYIEGNAVGGKQITHPFPAPDGYHDFKVAAEVEGINEINPLSMDAIYPNPASAITVIPVNLAYAVDNCSIVVTNMLGETVEVVYQGSLPSGEKNFFIDAGNYAAGMYQVIISSGEFKSVQKLMVK